MYASDPDRPSSKRGQLRVATTHPWNSEPADIRDLVKTFYTPNEIFFTRNHNAVPDIEAGGADCEWRLEIEANEKLGMKECEFTLDELKTKFPRYDVVATLQCAGNRQEEFVTKDRPLYVAPHWRNGAIGCARWSGVRVRDILGAAGLPVDEMALGKVDLSENAKIVNFVGEDVDETGVPYAGVIPVEKAIDPFGDTILAYEMNGQPLPRDHGFPVRVMAPGTAGCRNVKWVSSISVTAAASELDSGSKLDRHFAPDVEFKPAIRKGEEHLRLDQGPVIQTLPVQSIICDPLNASIIPGRHCDGTNNCSVADSFTVKGVAWSGGGRGICRVEVSADGGETFTAAELNKTKKTAKAPERSSACDACEGEGCPPPLQLDAPPPQQGVGRNWAWKHFEETIPLTLEQQAQLRRGDAVELEIVAKAIDGDFNSQPEKMSHTYNVLGICVNHWHRVKVTVDPRFSADDPDMPQAEPVPPPGYYNARHAAKT
jgi:sulfite oxidase